MAKEFALNIFELLAAIDKKDTSYYSKLTDEQKKGYTPLITMRWTAGTSDEKQILYVNELVNKYVFTIGKHPELMYKLQCAASSGVSRRYSWLAAKNTTKKIRGLEVVMEYHNWGVRDAKAAIHLLDPEDILAMAEELGYQKELAKLKKELK
jgi:hypothetical protein